MMRNDTECSHASRVLAKLEHRAMLPDLEGQPCGTIFNCQVRTEPIRLLSDMSRLDGHLMRKIIGSPSVRY